MFEDIEIRYYKESDIFHSSKTTSSWYYMPSFIKNILGVNTDFLSTEICYPYVGDDDLFDYDYFKKDKKFLKDKIVCVAIKDKKVVGITIFTLFKHLVYLKLFCIERIMRKSGFAKHFLNLCISLLRNNTDIPLMLISTEEGHNLYLKQGFKDIKYSKIKMLDNIGRFKWIEKSGNNSIGKYLMLYYDRNVKTSRPLKYTKRTSKRTSKRKIKNIKP